MTKDVAHVLEAEPNALRAACERARALVAENPQDEQAAETLFELVSQAGRELRREYRPERRDVAPEVFEAARLLDAGEQERAEALLRRHLAIVRNDPDAML